MKHSERGFTVVELLMVLMFVVGLAAAVASTYVTLSLITSGVKTVSQDCGVTYGIEAVCNGDWFCPENN